MNNEQNNLNGGVLGSVGTPNQTPQPNAVNPGNTVLGSTVVTPENQVVTPNPNPSVTPTNNEVMAVPTPTQVVTPNNNVMTGNTVLTPDSQVVTPTPAPEVVASPNSVVTPSEPANPAPATPVTPQSTPVNNTLNNGSGIPNPEVSYTNPQSINPAPMPGFEGQGTVGTTPPISLEKEKKPKKPTNKIAFIIIILALLAAVGGGTYYVLNYTDLLQKKATIKIDTKNFEVNLGESLPEDMNSYATITGTNASNCEKITDKVDLTKAGVYEYTIKCGDTTKLGTITVVDNTVLAVNPVTVYKSITDTTIEPVEFRGVNEDNLTYEFVNREEVINNLKTVGNYTVNLKVTNENGKTTEVVANLVVLEYPIKGNLICSSNSQNVTGTSIGMTFSGRYAIANAAGNPFGKIASETYTFSYSDETEFNSIQDKLSTDGSITINGINGTVTNTIIDTNNKTVTITNELSENDINTKYGNENFQNYSTIKSYFETTLGYTCSYTNQ